MRRGFEKNQNDFLGHIEDKKYQQDRSYGCTIKGRTLAKTDDDAISFPEMHWESFWKELAAQKILV